MLVSISSLTHFNSNCPSPLPNPTQLNSTPASNSSMSNEQVSPGPTTTPSSSSSLFPISSSAVTSASSANWLHNTSFTTDLSVVHNSLSSLPQPTPSSDEEDPPPQQQQQQSKKPYELLESSSSGSERKKKKRDTTRNKKKKKKKRKSRDNDDVGMFSFGSRKSGVRAWANSENKPSKDYYFDATGDPDNLAFGTLYRMDVVNYKLHERVISSDIDEQVYYRGSNRGPLVRGELDVDKLDYKLKSSGRYWSAKHAALERHRNLKRVRFSRPQKHMQVAFYDLIPLLEEDEDKKSMIEESWEDEVLRKTREFNKMTREHPHNVNVWFEFAEFQDKIASRQPQKAARLQTLEKKISILEKASELNPDDEDIMIRLLKAFHGRDGADIVIGRWEKILMQHSGSYKLWTEFLRVVRGEFSLFKVSEVRNMYVHAIQALSAAWRKRHRQVLPAAELHLQNSEDVEFELGMVDIFVSLCRFEWQAGYRELGTALFQAEMEYSLFCPPLQLTEQSKKRLFAHFWNSNGPRVGEDDALGWSTWLEKEEENRQKLLQEMSSKVDEQGGWTGWFVPASTDRDSTISGEDAIMTDVATDEMEEEKNDATLMQESDDDTLLKMLGVNVEVDETKEVHDTRTWARWSEEESSRDCDQWMPIHPKSGCSDSNDCVEGEEELSRVILFEDLTDFLFSLNTSEARLSLVMQFIDFFGGKVSQGICTNSSSWTEKILSLETLPSAILDYLRKGLGSPTDLETGSSPLNKEFFSLHQDTGFRKEMMKFLRNAALLCLRVFPRNYRIEEAILTAEEESNIGVNKSQYTSTPSQSLAKRLLKNDRQDVVLCGVYALREAAFGNTKNARKVFDMALSSINGLSLESQSVAAPVLCFWYAEMELADGLTSESESTSRALHILSYLGSGIPYSLYQGRPSGIHLLRAHQGFKDQITALRSSGARNVMDDSSVALICSAALFEELTGGWVAGAKVLSDAFFMVLPERKSRSDRVEFLFNYQLKMMHRHLQEAKLSTLLQTVSAGLQIYPFNPELLNSLVLFSRHYSVPTKLRQMLDELCRRRPSVIVWLFALSYELGTAGSRHRVHALFEKALANDALHSSVVIWRWYIAYEIQVENLSAARRVFFRAIHACPWSKMLWLDGFRKLNSVLSSKELSDLLEVMRDKELNLRTDIYEILLQDEFNEGKPVN